MEERDAREGSPAVHTPVGTPEAPLAIAEEIAEEGQALGDQEGTRTESVSAAGPHDAPALNPSTSTPEV